MYNVSKKFLYEILDDYKDAATNDEKTDILNSFMKLIWSSTNKRTVYEKGIKFVIPKSLLSTEIGSIFNQYSNISYTSYKSMSKNTDFCSLIRQKINNIYTNLCDKNVCLRKEYMDLIKIPKQTYYRWKNGDEYTPEEVTSIINTALSESIIVKEKFSKQKMHIEWNEYKKIITPFFKRMFDNFVPLDDFEDKNKLTIDINMWNEDNFAVAYLCKGLDGYMRNYQKEYYNVQRNKPIGRCECGGMFVQSKKNNKFKCDKCGSYQPIGTKIIQCIGCGCEMEVDSLDNQTKRCNQCYEVYRKGYKAAKEKERRKKLKDI